VIEPGRPPLEERGDQDDAEIGRLLRERLGRGAGNRLRPVEARGIFTLAEIDGPKQLGQADHLGPSRRRVRDRVLGVGEIPAGAGLTAHLHQGHPPGLGAGYAVVARLAHRGLE